MSLRAATIGAALAALASASGAAPTNPWLHGARHFRHVVRSLAVYRGELWVGTYGHGAYRRTAQGWTRVRSENSDLPEDRVNTLTVHEGRLWFGTCAGLAVRDGGTFVEHVRAGPDSVAHDIYHVVRPLSGGDLWVGTTGEGLSVWDGERWQTHSRAQGLLDPWVNDVLEGEGDSVWVATASGLYVGPPGRWREHHAAGKAPPLDTEFTALARQGKTLWTATMGEGLWGLRDGSWIRVPAELLPGRQVLALLVDRQERLWVGTDRGLARYRFDEGFQPVPGPLAAEEVKVLQLGDDGLLHVGTRSGGVYRRRSAEGLDFEEILRIDPATGEPQQETSAAKGPLPSLRRSPSPSPAPRPGADPSPPAHGSGR